MDKKYIVAVAVVVIVVAFPFLSRFLKSEPSAQTSAASAPAASAPAASAAAASAASAPENKNLAGAWVSVDFVRKVEDFKPGRKSWQGDLFLKDLQADAGGNTSLGWTWADGWINHSDGRTRAQYFVKTIDGTRYLFFPWLSGDVTERGMQPSYYVLKGPGVPPTAQATQPPLPKSSETSRGNSGFQMVRSIESVNVYDDVRWKDMSRLDLAGRPDLPATLNFNAKTVWPAGTGMPQGIFPEVILNTAMNPGLGVRELHRRGITGKGVNVAIIDQPLYQDHPEFKGKIAAYYDVGCESQSSMHGPAVASLLVGADCGTAPGASLYYVAAPSWKKDAAYYSKALDWIIEQNDKLPEDRKIRVVSVSAAPSGTETPFDQNQASWDEACTRAEAKGIMVLDCTQHHGFISACYYDPADPENVAKCKAGYPGMEGRFRADRLLVPASPRTVAEEYDEGVCSYQYCGRGGLSWAIPYCAGVLALGWEKRPSLTPSEMRELLFKSAHVDEQGLTFINPPEFVRLVQA